MYYILKNWYLPTLLFNWEILSETSFHFSTKIPARDGGIIKQNESGRNCESDFEMSHADLINARSKYSAKVRWFMDRERVMPLIAAIFRSQLNNLTAYYI